MDLAQIPIGRNPPHDVNVIVEIPQGGAPVKYEMDKRSGAMFVDRFLHTAMFYPANYGFIPHTLSEDGDPIDCMVVGPTPVVPGAVVRARPIGALLMEDEKGVDEKILAVPVDELGPFFKRVGSYRELPEIMLQQIRHFFEHYKDLEKGQRAALGGGGRGGRSDSGRHRASGRRLRRDAAPYFHARRAPIAQDPDGDDAPAPHLSELETVRRLAFVLELAARGMLKTKEGPPMTVMALSNAERQRRFPDLTRTVTLRPRAPPLITSLIENLRSPVPNGTRASRIAWAPDRTFSRRPIEARRLA